MSQLSQLIFVPSVTYISMFYLNVIKVEDSRIDDIREVEDRRDSISET